MVQVNRAQLASAIFVAQVDLDKPILYEATAKQSFHAADVWTKYYKEHEEPKEPKEPQAAVNTNTVKVLRLLREKKKISAIKEMRAFTGLGVNESKNRVDSLAQKFGHIAAERLSNDETIKEMLKTGFKEGAKDYGGTVKVKEEAIKF